MHHASIGGSYDVKKKKDTSPPCVHMKNAETFKDL